MKIKEIKKEAKGILFGGGNSLRLILLAILSMFAVLLPMLTYIYTSSLIMTLFDAEGENILLSYILPILPTVVVCVLVSFPAIAGVYRFGARVYDGDREDYLAGYTDGYAKNIAAGGILTLRWIPAVAALVLTFVLPTLASEAAVEYIQPYLEELYSEYDIFIDIEWLISVLISWGVMITLMIAAVMISLVIVLLSDRMFLFPYYLARGLSLRDALRRSGEVTRKHKGIGPKFLISFLGLICLSVLSLGLLFVFYTLPLMLMTYYSLAERITEGEQG